jgi:ribosomal protein S18 acetylase RimI-like enzyme
MTVELRPATEFDGATRARLFTAGYAGYFVPMNVDEPTLARFTEQWDVDLARSRVALRDGQPVGFANLALRGDLGWIAGVAVVPEARRQGIARVLMEAVLAEAPGDVLLEVIEQNVGAKALYEQLGFRTTRMLETWLWDGEPPASDARPAEARLVEPDAPWQRARPDLSSLEALEVDGGAVLFAPGERVSVAQLHARDLDAASALLAGARARGESLVYANAPEGSPAVAALAVLGATMSLRQFEMLLSRPTSAPRG